MSQTALARASGVPQPNIAAYESGARRPSRTTMERLRAAAKPRPSVALAQHRGDVERIVRLHKGSRPRVFGSVARGTDLSGSDVDLLVRFSPGASLFDVAELQADLEDLLGVEVDVVSERGLGRRAAEVLREARDL